MIQPRFHKIYPYVIKTRIVWIIAEAVNSLFPPIIEVACQYCQQTKPVHKHGTGRPDFPDTTVNNIGFFTTDDWGYYAREIESEKHHYNAFAP
ncbi:hypothetical protein [Pectobacterium brasiliense]|uniref:hypothetical protein n=1 Tax=Pectobacterium brasiliense TaxID=180957 RepID=UPI001968B8F1|nr:hypothetical protein [Pectobacterium brasiliense]